MASGSSAHSGRSGPLQRAGRTFRLLPLELEKVFQIAVVHCVGMGVQLPSMPLVMVYSAKPVPFGFCQPRPIASIGAISAGSNLVGRNHAMAFAEGVTAGDQRNCSSSFMAIRVKAMRMSRADPIGSPLAYGPSGLT